MLETKLSEVSRASDCSSVDAREDGTVRGIPTEPGLYWAQHRSDDRPRHVAFVSGQSPFLAINIADPEDSFRFSGPLSEFIRFVRVAAPCREDGTGV